MARECGPSNFFVWRISKQLDRPHKAGDDE
jgi:hypothetical protein